MKKTTRCKFHCGARREDDMNVYVTLHAVTDGSDENREFWSATPMGTLELAISNKPAASMFEVGKEYYLDISRA